MDNPMINIGGWCACAGFLLCFKSQLWRSSLDISWGSVRSDVCGLLVTRPGVQTVSIYAVSLYYTPHWHSPLWRHTTFRHTASSAAPAPAAGSPEHSVLALLHINTTTSPSPWPPQAKAQSPKSHSCPHRSRQEDHQWLSNIHTQPKPQTCQARLFVSNNFHFIYIFIYSLVELVDTFSWLIECSNAFCEF